MDNGPTDDMIQPATTSIDETSKDNETTTTMIESADAHASKKRNNVDALEKAVESSIGKIIDRSRQLLSSPVKSLLNSFRGTTAAPAEPEEGPPNIDCIVPMMLLGPVGVGQGVLEHALLDLISRCAATMTVDEYKKDFAFETINETEETTTNRMIHSVRLKLYDCYGMNPTDQLDGEFKNSTKANALAWQDAIKSVHTIVLALSVTRFENQQQLVTSIEKWTSWINQEFIVLQITDPPDIVLLLTQVDTESPSPVEWLSDDSDDSLTQACQTNGVQSWHAITADDIPNRVSSVDDLLHALVERRVQNLKPILPSSEEAKEEEDSPLSSKRRKVEQEVAMEEIEGAEVDSFNQT